MWTWLWQSTSYVMRKRGDVDDAPATHIQDATINTYCVTDAVRPALSLYFITVFAQVDFIKIANYECSSRRKYYFFPFMFEECQKSIIYHHTYSIVNRRIVSRHGVGCRRAPRVHTPPILLYLFWTFECMYIKILSLTWFRHIKWGETSRNLPFVFSETLAMSQNRFAREMKYWRRPPYASFTICLWNVLDTTRCLFWIYRPHIGNFHNYHTSSTVASWSPEI